MQVSATVKQHLTVEVRPYNALTQMRKDWLRSILGNDHCLDDVHLFKGDWCEWADFSGSSREVIRRAEPKELDVYTSFKVLLEYHSS